MLTPRGPLAPLAREGRSQDQRELSRTVSHDSVETASVKHGLYGSRPVGPRNPLTPGHVAAVRVGAGALAVAGVAAMPFLSSARTDVVLGLIVVAAVATSVREGWGLVVDEAAAMGTVTVAYDVAGLRDAVPLAGGVLVAPTPPALAESLRTILEQQDAASPPRAGDALPWSHVAVEVLPRSRDISPVAGAA